MEKEIIEELMAKERLSQDEKKEITAEADALGIEYTLKGNCRACYDKLLTKIYEAVKGTESKPESEAKPTANVSRDGWRLKNPQTAFRMAGVLWDNETIKERKVGGIHPFVRAKYFVKVSE